MKLNKIQKIIVIIVALALLFGVYVFFDRRNKDTEPVIKGPSATTTVVSQNTGGYTIEQVPIDDGLPKPIPDLNRKVVIYPGAIVNEQSKVSVLEKIVVFQTKLKNNPADLTTWNDLGSYQKIAGDYDGAIISWKYANRLAPKDYVSLSNLGNIYAYYLKDNGMAEVYYKQAISKDPKQAYLYVQLAEVYIDIFKNEEKALNIINQGLKEVPGDSRLLQLKDGLTK